MSTCTPEEIAEKRRIALERLKSRQQTESQPISRSTITKPTLPSAPTGTGNNAANFLRAFQVSHNSKMGNERSMNPVRVATQPYPKQSPYQKQRNGNFKNAPSSSQPVTSAAASTYVPNCIRVVTCRLEMTTEHRFALHMSEYHSKVIDVCKSIPTKTYHPDTRDWSFDLKDYQLVVDRMAPLRPNVTLAEIPKKVLAICTSSSPLDDVTISSYLSSISDTITDVLLPFQREGVAFGISKQGRVLIADEMGLGKTYQALALADLYKEDWPLLIATTASTKDSWLSHIHKLMPHVNCQYIASISASHDYFEDAKVVICSYQMLEKCYEKLASMGMGVLIMDESHMLKNSKAKCTAVADKLSRKAKRVILLSGTPALSRPAELYSQLKMLDRSFLTYMDYTVRYCEGKSGNFGWDASGQDNLNELKVILAKKFMIRRTKAEVLPQLVEKNRETVYLDPALIKTNATLNHFAKAIGNSVGHIKEADLMMYYSETAKIKCPAICAYVKDVAKQKVKFIVFAHHKVVMDGICETLKELKVSHIRIDGSTKNDVRAQKVNRFQTKTTCRVAVLSLKSCNAGITLTAAQLVLFAELDWNPSTLAQAESRAHRIGQESEVTCRYLLARGTADDLIWRLLHNKQDVLNKAGLFAEDLRENNHIAGPNSAGDITKYVVKTPRKADQSTNKNTSISSSDADSPIKTLLGNRKQPDPSENKYDDMFNESFDDLLNDGDDDDFAGIDI